MTGQFKILPDSCCELTETFFLFMYLPGARELGFQKWMCFLGKVVSCRLWGCGSVLCHLNEWLLILPCLCFSSSVCICTLNFLERPLAYLLFSVRLCTILHTMTPRWWNTGHESLYSSRFFFSTKGTCIHASRIHIHCRCADKPTQAACLQTRLSASTNAQICTSTSRIHALTKTHTDTNTYPALSLWVFPTPCESRRSRLQLLLSAEGGAHALLCVTPLLFPPGLNFKSNTPPFFYQHSLITSPSSSSPSSSLPPYPLPSIFSDMIPFNSSPLSNPPHPPASQPPFHLHLPSIFLLCSLSPFLSL